METIKLDIPLFIRLLEFAREDAKTDLDLHVVTENIIKLSECNCVLNMDDYNDIVKDYNKEDTSIERMQELAGLK